MSLAAFGMGWGWRGSPVLGAGVVVHTGEGGRAPGAVRLLLHSPLVSIADPDVRDPHS